MATINISSIVQYYNTGNGVGSGTAEVSGYINSDGAKSAAEAEARRQANNIGGGTPNSGGSSSTSGRKFGTVYGRVTSSIGIPHAMADSSGTFEGSCSWSATRTSTMYQLKLKFTLPSGVTTSNLSTATLSFSATSNSTTKQNYRVCAPKSTTEQTSYEKYGSTTTLDTSTYTEFSSPENTASTAYNLTITNIFKKCITNNQGWITILIPSATSYGDRYMTITGTPTITYTTSYTKCGAPTSIGFTSIVKPGGSLTISWSGASAGTNNTITGYDVYYKIGAAPTTSSYDGTASVSSTNTSASKTFTISSSANIRGEIFYAMVRTKGSAGSSYYSDWKSGNGGKVNSLPGTPTVSVDKTRIKSTGSTTVKFTVTAGADNDISQTKTLYYATSASGTKTSFTSPLSVSLSAAATYYFWTYDGLEYSSSYTSKTIKVNTLPTIGSITMSAYNNTTYSPSVRNGYVKNINGSARNVTKDSAATLTYQWKLQIGSGTSATSYGTTTNISIATSLSNIDVTSYGATFNTAYRLALTVTDDLGESATAYSSEVFAIPAIPTITIINNKSDTNYGGNTNNSHFDNGLRIKYSAENTGITRELQYSTSSSFSSYSTLSLSGTSYSDVTTTSLTRGTTYYFRVKYTCNTKTATTAISSGYMRAKDITPASLTITPQSGSTIKPYTQEVLNFTFTNSPITWAAAQDVATSYGGIYSIKLKYSTRSLNVTSSGTHSSDTVTGTVTLSSISTASWKTLLGTTNAPNASYTITLEITATNGFGATFVGTKTFNVNFKEGFVANQGNLQLSIKTSSGFTTIPTSTYTSSNRYSLFPTQTIRFTISGLQCYANQSFTVTVRDADSPETILGTISGTANDWELLSGSTRIYSLKTSGNKSIDYLISSISTSVNKTFHVLVTLDNGYTKELTSSICKYRRIQTSSIKPKITAVSESEPSSNIFNFTYQITDYGGDTVVETGFSTASKQGGYSSITGRFIKSATSNGTYQNVGSSNIDLKGKNAETLVQNVNDTSSPINNDILYFGIEVYLTVAFVKIGNATPTGTSSYTLTFKGLYTLHRATPNLLYGKNFFVMNGTVPRSESNMLLEIKDTNTRNTIYIGNSDTAGTLQITTGGLVIDCGSW